MYTTRSCCCWSLLPKPDDPLHTAGWWFWEAPPCNCQEWGLKSLPHTKTIIFARKESLTNPFHHLLDMHTHLILFHIFQLEENQNWPKRLMLGKQCSFALLPVDMGIELECNSQGFRRSNAQKKKKSAATANVETHKQCSKKKKKKKSSAIANVQTTSNAICKKEKTCTINCTKKKNKSAITRRKKERKWCNVQRRRKSAIAMVDTKEKCR